MELHTYFEIDRIYKERAKAVSAKHAETLDMCEKGIVVNFSLARVIDRLNYDKKVTGVIIE